MKKKLLNELLNIFKKNIKFEHLNLHEPSVDKSDLYNLKKCIYSNQIALGNFVKKFEKKLSTITKSRYVITTNSGVSALHICCLLLGTKKNNEILVPSFTFVASANAVKYCGAVPHFVDIEENNFGINILKLESYMLEGSFSATQFYADIEGHPDQVDVRLALEELGFFSKEVKVLGVYPASDYRKKT